MTESFGAKRAVVCDDDALIRSVVAQLLADAGFDVAGEAETIDAGLEILDRTAPDVAVVDLSLGRGTGEELLRAASVTHPDLRTVVFSAFVDDQDHLRRAGADEVVHKPEFDRLAAVLADLATDLGERPERRRPAPRTITPLPPPAAISLSGFEPWCSLETAVAGLATGDALLAVDICPDPMLRLHWDEVFRADFRLAVGRALATERRAQDRISLSPCGFPVLLLVAGHPEAPMSVFDRLDARWRREVASGRPIGAFGSIRDHDEPLDRLAAVAAALRSPSGPPLRMV